MRCPQQWLRNPSQRPGEEGLDGEIEMITPVSIFRTVGRVSRPSSRQNSNHSGSLQHDSQSRGLERGQPVLPAADGGFEAWMMLAASMLIQVPVWGYSLAFGIFEEYYSNLHGSVIQGDQNELAVIGTTYTGILYLLSPITFTLLTWYPRLRRYFGPIGMILLIIGFLLSSFATQIWQLIATQGVLSAIGAGLLFSPTTMYLDEWFIRRKGLAYGIMWAAKSISGVVLPFLAQACLDKFGPRATLRAWVVTIILTSLPAIKFIRPRLPVLSISTSSTGLRPIDLSFLRLSSFWMLQIGNVIQSFGYFLPQIYLPSYTTTTIGLSPTMGTLMVAIFGASSVIGGIILGFACDRVDVTKVMLVSSVGSSLSVWTFWGLSMPITGSNITPKIALSISSLGTAATTTSNITVATAANTPSTTASSTTTVSLLVLFSLFYGFFAGGFSSTWSGILTQLKAESPGLNTGFMFGLLAGGRGIGNVISGPLSSALLATYQVGYDSPVASREGGEPFSSSYGSMMVAPSNGYETQYGSLIIFTGVTALLGGWNWFWRCLRKTAQRCS